MQRVDQCDAAYFRMNRSEAVAIDPQTRMLLEVSNLSYVLSGSNLYLTEQSFAKLPHQFLGHLWPS